MHQVAPERPGGQIDDVESLRSSVESEVMNQPQRTSEFAPPPTELLRALEHGDLERARREIVNGADVIIADSRPVVGDGMTPLHHAALTDDADLICSRADNRADVNARTWSGQTPLWLASNCGRRIAVRALLELGADPNIRCSEGYSPLGRVVASDGELMALIQSYGGVL